LTLRLTIAAAIVVVAVVVAWRIERQRAAPPTRDAFPVPHQLDRDDFPRPDAPWLVALFSAERCDSCRGIPEKLDVLESDLVATAVVADEARRDLHRHYDIAGIPTVVIADAEGVVRRAFVGPLTATDLWAAVAEVRAPGTTPEPDLGADL